MWNFIQNPNKDSCAASKTDSKVCEIQNIYDPSIPEKKHKGLVLSHTITYYKTVLY